VQKVENYELEWMHKQELSQKILELQTSKDDVKLLEESQDIVEGLKELSKVLEYRELKLIDTIKCESQLTKNVISFQEIKELLKGFMQVGTPTVNKLKC
jgi:hypothetical protein